MIAKGLLLQSLERAEAAMDEYLELCGIPVSEVKQRTPLSDGFASAARYQYFVRPGISVYSAIGWLADEEVQDLGARAMLISEIAIAMTPSDPVLLRKALELNHQFPGHGRISLLDRGQYLGVTMWLDLITVQDALIGSIIQAHLTSAEVTLNLLSSFGNIEPLGVTLQRLRESSGDPH